MQFIVDGLSFIISFFMKKLAEKSLTLPIKVAVATIQGIAITLYIASFIAFANFIFKVVNMFYDFLQKSSSVSASSHFYGVSFSIDTVLSFLHASGIGEAFYTALSLYLSLLFGYLGVKLSIISAKAVRDTAKMISDTAMVTEL